jgi:hypothetical protein
VKRVKKPWFDLTFNEDDTMEYGEDIWFCKQINESGFEVWVDPTIRTGHIGTHIF